MNIYSKSLCKEKIYRNLNMIKQGVIMNDWQLYEYYLSIPLSTIIQRSWIYPKYVKIIGRSIAGPHPHMHLDFCNFLDLINNDIFFHDKLNKKS